MVTDESARIEALLARAQAGDGQAQEALLQAYDHDIRQAVHIRRERAGHVLRERELSDDLYQLSIMRILSALPKHLWRGRAAFTAWLRTLVRSEVVDQQRYHAAQRRQPPQLQPLQAEEEAPAPSVRAPESVIDAAQRRAVLTQLLPKLSNEQLQALSMHHAGHTHAEIAEALGCSAEAARKHVSRGEARLVELLAAYEGRKTQG